MKDNNKYHFPSALNQYLNFYNPKQPNLNRPEIISDVECNNELISNSRMKNIDL